MSQGVKLWSSSLPQDHIQMGETDLKYTMSIQCIKCNNKINVLG